MSSTPLPIVRARPGALLALLAALLLALPVGAQTWMRLEPDAALRARDLARSPAGLLAVVEDDAGLSRVMLLDAHGTHLRTLQLFTPGDVPPLVNTAHFLGEDTLLLAGSLDLRPWAARVAVADGAVAWARTLTTTDQGGIQAIEVNDLGHMVLFGYGVGGGGLGESILAALSPSTGGVHYRRKWPGGFVTTLTTLANGDMLVAQHGRLTRTTAWGHPVWSRRIDSSTALYQSRYVETPDGDLLALGVHSPAHLEYRFATWSFAGDGTPLWARSIDTFLSPEFGEWVDLTGAAPTADGGLVAGVTQASPLDNLRGGGVMRLDADGNLLWMRSLDTLGHSDGAVGMARTPGDGVVVLIDDEDAGYTVARLDAQGQSASCAVNSLGILGQQSLELAAHDEPVSVSNIEELWQDTAHFPLVSARQLVELCSDTCSVTGDSYGEGTAGSGGFTPRLHANDGACVGATPTLELADALGGAPGLIFLGFAPAELPGFGGTFLVNPSPMQIFHVQLGGAPGVPGAGYAGFPTGTDLTSVQGLTVYLQGVFADPAGPTGKTLSNAVSVSIR